MRFVLRSLPLSLYCGIIAFGFSITPAQIQTRTVLLPDSLAGVVNAQWVLYEPQNDKIFIAGNLGKCLLVMSGETLERIKRLPMPAGIRTMALDSVRRRVYVPIFDSSLVVIVDAEQDSILRRLPTAWAPSAIAFSARTNRMYVS
ncbi:MAG: hypothetical protein ABIK42_04640, partial [candidate division WOR-3 bacterium]